MKILIVSATAIENRLISDKQVETGTPIKVRKQFNHDIDALVTGVGAVPTTFFLTRVASDYDLVINIGIAGSFSPSHEIGSVVCVKQDLFGDYGIDDRGEFKSLSDLKINGSEDFPFKGDTIENPSLEKFLWIELPFVKGVTHSTGSGSAERIGEVNKRWNADIETMESASVFYVCSLMGIKFICLRAISNRVEPRDRSKWDIEKAINNLTIETRKFITGIPLSFR